MYAQKYEYTNTIKIRLIQTKKRHTITLKHTNTYLYKYKDKHKMNTEEQISTKREICVSNRKQLRVNHKEREIQNIYAH